MGICAGFGRPLGAGVLQECPYNALQEVDGAAYCDYHAAIVQGHITSGDPRSFDGELAWTPNRKKPPARARDPLMILLEEWER